jgi:hypothetical protein
LLRQRTTLLCPLHQRLGRLDAHREEGPVIRIGQRRQASEGRNGHPVGSLLDQRQEFGRTIGPDAQLVG